MQTQDVKKPSTTQGMIHSIQTNLKKVMFVLLGIIFRKNGICSVPEQIQKM